MKRVLLPIAHSYCLPPFGLMQIATRRIHLAFGNDVYIVLEEKWEGDKLFGYGAAERGLFELLSSGSGILQYKIPLPNKASAIQVGHHDYKLFMLISMRKDIAYPLIVNIDSRRFYSQYFIFDLEKKS